MISYVVEEWETILKLAEETGVGVMDIGTTGGSRLRISPHYVTIDLSLEEAVAAYESGLGRALEGVTANV